MLEVIALDAHDALAAERGGADRLEVVADMAADGLTPDPRIVKEIAQTTALPQRVMLRGGPGFRTTPAELDRLSRQAEALAEAGAAGFVFGFLDQDGRIDEAGTARLAAGIAPLPWTFHRALDHAADPDDGWRTVRRLAGLDAVLTAGSADGVTAGLDRLVQRAAGGGSDLLLVGGGLRLAHLERLRAAGVGAFHVGGPVRAEGRWDRPVERGLVAEWAAAAGR